MNNGQLDLMVSSNYGSRMFVFSISKVHMQTLEDDLIHS